MRVDRLMELADFLETKVPPEQFDMEHWWRAKDEWSCATSACAAGWATVLFKGEGLGLELTRSPLGGFYCSALLFEVLSGFAALMAFFGLANEEQAGLLFGAVQRTPAEEAAVIRELVNASMPEE